MPQSCAAGIYLHWPFCERKCPYCDFYTFGREHPAHGDAQRFVPALLAEIASNAEWSCPAGRRTVDSIYFGGGTPSLMGPAVLDQVLTELADVYEFAADTEITLEVNPTTAEAAELPTLIGLGVNRVSVGAQSFKDATLRQLGRVHDAATTRRAIDLIRAAGMENLSLDLMFGVPGQDFEAFSDDLAALLACAPEHVSAYNLTLHSGTPFARWHASGKLTLPHEDEQVRMFEHLMDRLGEAGYLHYEISNWCRPGLHARHNSKYWRDCDVFAFGPSAHGVIGGRRFANPPDLHAYLDVDTRELGQLQDPPATDRARAGEVMMLVLRRVEGVTWAEISGWMGKDAREFYGRELARLSADGLLEMNEQGVRLTRRGILLADSVMEEFF